MNIEPIMRRATFPKKNAEEYLNKVFCNPGAGGTALTSHLISFFQTCRENCDSKQPTR